jgi:SNF2 family DNA or RNA helicase
MQAEDYLDMPDLVQNNVYVDLPVKVQSQYKRFEKELVAELENDTVYALNAASAYTKCRQLASGPIYLIDEDGRKEQAPNTTAKYKYAVAHTAKFEALKELSESVNGKPILIFYNFRHELQELQNLQGFSRKAVIQGGMKESDVADIIEKWNDNKFNFLFCQWRAASHGLNLQKGDCADIVCFGLTDSPETYEQAYRRIYRQGVEAKQIRIHRIITRGTIEEVQLQRLEGKFETQREFLQALKNNAKGHLRRKAG